MNTPFITGLHHVTAITADPQKNLDFYTRTLGLHLVKLTVNYDDPSSYHLYYGDGLGRPGTIMTFFAWPGARRGTVGTGQVTETAWAIPVASAEYWAQRLAGKGLSARPTSRFGSNALLFEDPDGMALALIESPEAGADAGIVQQGEVPAEHAIRAFHGVTLYETDEKLPAGVLVERFGYRETGREGRRVRYQSAAGNRAHFVDVVLAGQRSIPRMGAGQVHHVAFRTPTDDEQARWLDALLRDGRNVSPVMDRDYFHSIYFREPGGTLFEIATDAPGFAINEPAEALGTRLMLPRWLEPNRAVIEASLPPLKLPESPTAAVAGGI